jgi:hypothetical protein
MGKKTKGEKIKFVQTVIQTANEEIRVKYKGKTEKCLKEQVLMINNMEECWIKIKTKYVKRCRRSPRRKEKSNKERMF